MIDDYQMMDVLKNYSSRLLPCTVQPDARISDFLSTSRLSIDERPEGVGSNLTDITM